MFHSHPLVRDHEPRLSSTEGGALLRLARSAVETCAINGANGFDIGGFDLPQRLLEHRGAFVTLRIAGALRGCMGFIENTRPLAATVCRAAIRAAFEDPRFAPVVARELGALSYEVSALEIGDSSETPFRRIRGAEDIMIGADGLMIRAPGNRVGLLLPQVAVEQHWNERAFLAGACRKAGLAGDAWEAPGVELYRFRAQVFREE